MCTDTEAVFGCIKQSTSDKEWQTYTEVTVTGIAAGEWVIPTG